MNPFKNDNLTILNYQGSKKNLLEFIYKNTVEVVDDNKAVLDMFAGSCSVGYGLKRYYKMYANDSEYYSYAISKALLQYKSRDTWKAYKEKFLRDFSENYERVNMIVGNHIIEEKKLLFTENKIKLEELYDKYPTAWNGKLNYQVGNITLRTAKDLRENKYNIPFMMFTTYYANTNFGVEQSVEIDSIRYAIHKLSEPKLKYVLLSCLFYAMKECVFSKDGHMAQPLDRVNHFNKLIKVRKKQIRKLFMNKIEEFHSDQFISTHHENKVFNLKANDILKLDEIKNEVGLIYADPPYTDMQYSRYYHLLNSVALYDYDDISLYRGNLSKGLYRSQRFQSPLSQRSKAEQGIDDIFQFCRINSINLALSYAYPRDRETQAFDRYTMDIDTIINIAEKTFGKGNCNVLTEEYEHSNNRNKQTKKVLEYLIVCKNR
jgi:adenine-specific DNA methylase